MNINLIDPIKKIANIDSGLKMVDFIIVFT